MKEEIFERARRRYPGPVELWSRCLWDASAEEYPPELHADHAKHIAQLDRNLSEARETRRKQRTV